MKLRSIVTGVLMLFGSTNLALAQDQFDSSGTWDVKDSNGNDIGDLTSSNNGMFADFADDPNQNHPPNSDASLCWLVPNPGDAKYDYIPANGYRVMFSKVYVDGVVVAYYWYKYSYATTPPQLVEWGTVTPQ